MSIVRETALENAIRKHRDAVRADPCHEHDSELWAVLGDGDTEWPLVKDGIFDRIHGCLLYLQTHEYKREGSMTLQEDALRVLQDEEDYRKSAEKYIDRQG